MAVTQGSGTPLCLLCLLFHLTLMDLEIECQTAAADVHMALSVLVSRT